MALFVVLLAGAVSTVRAQPQAEGRGTWWGAPYLGDQWRRSIPESPAVRVPSPITRDDQVQDVSLKEAIGMALENNPGIAAQRLEPGRVGTNVLGAEAVFDPTLAAEIQTATQTTPNASSLSSVAVTNVDDRFANVHLLKTLRTGAQVTLDSLNERIDNNASFQSLRPQYVPSLNFSLVQPLLRNFGWDFSYLVVRIAQENSDAAVFTYQAQVADFVEQVVEAYWAIVGARENVAVQRESKALADRTVSENEARVKVGLLPPVAVLEAQADAKAREEQVIIAENNLAIARQQLAQLVFFRPKDTFVPRTLEPVEELAIRDVEVDLDAALGVALENRPEILASQRTVRATQLNERIAQNGLLPRVDLVGSYGVNALSGRTGPPRPFVSQVNTGGCVPALRDASGKPIIFQCPGRSIIYAGPASDAYDRLTSNDFRSYSVGVQVQVPLSNAAARSAFAERTIERDQAELNHRQLLSNVTLEVRQTTADLIAARQRIDTTRVARELAEENLRNQQKRHEVGMATTKDLLDFQTRLTTARAAEVQARIDYVTALSRWRRAQGRLLSQYQIVIDQPGRHSTPWFARF
ncbi:MAG TPA: TolC family protein [Candidatus Binatia bacterium]|nr:TolC family protein [Candidatus Binatia bacterium]